MYMLAAFLCLQALYTSILVCALQVHAFDPAHAGLAAQPEPRSLQFHEQLCLCRLIHTYCPEAHNDTIQLAQGNGGPLQGMTAKVKAAWTAAQQGCTAVIANGKTSDALLQVGRPSSAESAMPSIGLWH